MSEITIITSQDLGESLEVKSNKLDIALSQESNNGLTIEQDGIFVNPKTIKGSWIPVVNDTQAEFKAIFDFNINAEITDPEFNKYVKGKTFSIPDYINNYAFVQPFKPEFESNPKVDFDFIEDTAQIYFNFQGSELQSGVFQTSVGFGSQNIINDEIVEVNATRTVSVNYSGGDLTLLVGTQSVPVVQTVSFEEFKEKEFQLVYQGSTNTLSLYIDGIQSTTITDQSVGLNCLVVVKEDGKLGLNFLNEVQGIQNTTHLLVGDVGVLDVSALEPFEAYQISEEVKGLVKKNDIVIVNSDNTVLKIIRDSYEVEIPETKYFDSIIKGQDFTINSGLQGEFIIIDEDTQAQVEITLDASGRGFDVRVLNLSSVDVSFTDGINTLEDIDQNFLIRKNGIADLTFTGFNWILRGDFKV